MLEERFSIGYLLNTFQKSEMSDAQIKAANENGLQEVELLDKARLPELKEGQRSAAIEEGKAFRAEIGTRDPTLIETEGRWSKTEGNICLQNLL